MSYARFGWNNSNVYVYEHYAGFIECCGCSLTEADEDEDFGFFKAKTANEMVKHLDAHVAAGDVVPKNCYERILEEYKDLDGRILPFEEQKKTGRVTEERQ